MKLIDKYWSLIGVILVLFFLFIYLHTSYSDVEKNGVITIARVVRYEASESGSDLYLEICIRNEKIVTSVGQDYEWGAIGKYYFVKVLKENPKYYPILYGKRKVPDCIISNMKYFEGWSYFPDCNNYMNP